MKPSARFFKKNRMRNPHTQLSPFLSFLLRPLTPVSAAPTVPVPSRTTLTAARKGQGGIVVGNILGADILNICWIAGASATVNPLVVELRVIHFSFPAMLVIVGAMLVMMRTRHRLTKGEGVFLLALYGVYMGLIAKLVL